MASELPYRRHQLVRGTVLRQAPYGVWIRLDTQCEGLLLIENISDSHERLTESGFPAVGDTIRAVVLSCSLVDDSLKISLSTKESDMP